MSPEPPTPEELSAPSAGGAAPLHATISATIPDPSAGPVAGLMSDPVPATAPSRSADPADPADPADSADPAGGFDELAVLDQLEADLTAVEQAITTLDQISSDGVGGERAAAEIAAAVSTDRFGDPDAQGSATSATSAAAQSSPSPA